MCGDVVSEFVKQPATRTIDRRKVALDVRPVGARVPVDASFVVVVMQKRGDNEPCREHKKRDAVHNAKLQRAKRFGVENQNASPSRETSQRNANAANVSRVVVWPKMVSIFAYTILLFNNGKKKRNDI